LNANEMTTAFAITASLAAGIKANFGTATKPLQVGRAAQNGVFAARMASFGADASPGAFEHDQGFGAVYNGIGSFDPSAAEQAMANPWDLIDPGLVVKRYPCCGSTHGAVDAALALRAKVDNPDDIDEVRIWTHPRRLRHTNRPSVHTGLEAKFSVQYVVSRALHSGSVGLGDFTPGAITDPAVVKLMAKVDAQPMPEGRWGADHFPAEVELRLAGGRTINHRVERPRGNGPEEALTDEELSEKFIDCCRVAGVADDIATRLQRDILELESVERLDTFANLLRLDTANRRP
jgi:2-methylcitrate dehydratase PrpD